MARRTLVLGVSTFVTVTALMLAAYGMFSVKYFYLQIHGESMVPAFQDGDRVIFEKVEDPGVGDFVVFKLPKAWEQEWLGEADPRFIKRVAAEQGDVLTWDGQAWARNGEIFSSLKTGSCPIEPMGFELPEGQYFVTGDTTIGHTLDSREAFCKGLSYLVSQEDIVQAGRVKKVL